MAFFEFMFRDLAHFVGVMILILLLCLTAESILVSWAKAFQGRGK